MDLEQALAVLLGHADQKEVIKLIQTKGQGIYQTIFNSGHSTATTQANEQRSRVEGQLTTAQAKIVELETKMQGLQAGQPNVKEYEDQIRDLKKQIKDREDNDKAATRKGKMADARTNLRKKLEKLGVDPVFASSHVESSEISNRLHQTDASDDVVVTQKGLNIPIISSDGQDPLDVLAAEIKGGLPSRLIVASTDRGSETQGSGGDGSGGKNKWDAAREAAKSREAARGTTSGMEELAKRRGFKTE